MQLFVDSPEVKRKILKIKTYALNNPVDLTKGIPENLVPVGDKKEHVYENGTTRIVYSVEKQPVGLCHHLSISKQNKQYPNVVIFNKVMELLGMGSLDDGQQREIYPENNCSINVIQLMGEKDAK